MDSLKQPVFQEKQYLGFNKYTLFSRIGLATICFAAWFINRGQVNSRLFLIAGLLIVVVSVFLFFVLHLHTKVFQDHIILEGFWTTRKVKIDLNSINEVEHVSYNSYFLNNPVYNLHHKGMIRFYTRGNHAIKLKDKDGLVYLIGTQHPSVFHKIVNVRISINK